MKGKVAKKTKLRLSILGTLSMLVIVYFFITLSLHLYKIYDLHCEKKYLEEKYLLLQKEADDLQIEINKLNNPEYLARYAREKFSYSKNGEYIIKLNDTNEQIEEVSNELNSNYIVVALCGVIFLIFIYIIIKSRKKET